MEMMHRRTLLCFLFFLSCTLILHQQVFAAKKSYVVYLGGHYTDSNEETIVNSHHELLGSVMNCKEKAKDAIFYSYTKAINGFAAVMEEEEAEEILGNPNVISVFENRVNKLFTTHSWDFIGLTENISSSSLISANASSDLIIGHIDTGVWPESKSFSDDGMGPIPSKWKGICENKNVSNFACNKKLIGARYYYAGYVSSGGSINDTKTGPRDDVGHGTHTLSTSAGNPIANVSFFGFANGTLRGGSPHARVAMYKVCWADGECYDADILAAFDGAINDGVDLISVSLGADPRPYFADSISIGSFHAMEKGVIVVCAGGNSGPVGSTITNGAPWIFTVAAGTTDRQFPADFEFNGDTMNGMSFSPGLPSKDLYPVISSIDASLDSSDDYCTRNNLDPAKTKGKIVVCNLGQYDVDLQVEEVQRAGGVGVVLANDEMSGDELFRYPFNFTTINISYQDGDSLNEYLAYNKTVKGYISCGKTTFGNKPAPQIAGFSSRGPYIISEDILKPDILAPGVFILASFPDTMSPIGEPSDPLRTSYTFMSGTSMATPHVAGLAGLLKSLNPTWSPAMIRSAIMTTATTRDNKGGVITAELNSDHIRSDPGSPFDFGAGHIQARKAMDPGLVYDMTPQDYVNYLCTLGYNSSVMKVFIAQYKCPSTPINVKDLNYPSISITNISHVVSVNRTLTNVGPPSKYKVSYIAPEGTSVKVSPMELEFDKVGDTKDFQVVITPVSPKFKYWMFGNLTWFDGKHSVTSHLAVI